MNAHKRHIWLWNLIASLQVNIQKDPTRGDIIYLNFRNIDIDRNVNQINLVFICHTYKHIFSNNDMQFVSNFPKTLHNLLAKFPNRSPISNYSVCQICSLNTYRQGCIPIHHPIYRCDITHALMRSQICLFQLCISNAKLYHKETTFATKINKISILPWFASSKKQSCDWNH